MPSNITSAGVIVLGDAGILVIQSSLTHQPGIRARLGAGVPRSRQESFTDIPSLIADLVDICHSATYHPTWLAGSTTINSSLVSILDSIGAD
jgi:hypothetical protein